MIYDVTQTMKTLESLFSRLWLTDNEVEMYLILLKWWWQSTTTLARKLRKPRTTLYSHLDWLLNKWMIQVEQTARWQRFNALSFDNLLIALEQKKKKLNDSVSDLMYARDEYEATKLEMSFVPKIKIYETKEARNIVYKKIQNFTEAFSIFNYDAAIKFMQWNKKRREQAWVVLPGSYVKEILIDSPQARKYKKKREKKNHWRHEVKLLAEDNLWSIQSDILLVDGVYYHSSLGDRVVMVEINDPIFYNSQKALFDYIRNSLAS